MSCPIDRDTEPSTSVLQRSAGHAPGGLDNALLQRPGRPPEGRAGALARVGRLAAELADDRADARVEDAQRPDEEVRDLASRHLLGRRAKALAQDLRHLREPCA